MEESREVKRQRVAWEEDEIAMAREIAATVEATFAVMHWPEVTARYNLWASRNGKATRTINSIKSKVGLPGRSHPIRWTSEEDEWLVRYDIATNSWRQMWVDLGKADISPTPRQPAAVRRHYQILMTRQRQLGGEANTATPQSISGMTRQSTVISQWSSEENLVLETLGFSCPSLCELFNERMRQLTGQQNYYRNHDAVERQAKRLEAGTVPRRQPRKNFIWTVANDEALRDIQRSRNPTRATGQLARALGVDRKSVRKRYNELFRDTIDANLDLPLCVEDEEIKVADLLLYDDVLLQQHENDTHIRNVVELVIVDMIQKIVTFDLTSREFDDMKAVNEGCGDVTEGKNGFYDDNKSYRADGSPLAVSMSAVVPEALQEQFSLDTVNGCESLERSSVEQIIEPKSNHQAPLRLSDCQLYFRFRSKQGKLLDCDIECYSRALRGVAERREHKSRWSTWIIDTGSLLAPYSTDQFIDWNKRSHVQGRDSLFLMQLLFLRLCVDRDVNLVVALLREWDDIGLSCSLRNCCVDYDMSDQNIELDTHCCHWYFLTKANVSIPCDLKEEREYRLRCALAVLREGQGAWQTRMRDNMSQSCNMDAVVKMPRLLIECFAGAEVSGYLHLGTMNLVVIQLCRFVQTGEHTKIETKNASVGVLHKGSRTSVALLVRDRHQRYFFVVSDRDWLKEKDLKHVSWSYIDSFHQQADRLKAIINAYNPILLSALRTRSPTLVKHELSIRNLFKLWPRYREELDKLNSGQRAAVNQLLMGKGVLPVRGPFGCGKSYAIALAVSLHHLRCFGRLEGYQQVLVVAESNAAIDACLTRVMALGYVDKGQMVRLGETSIHALQSCSTRSMVMDAQAASRRRFKRWSEQQHLNAAREEVRSRIRNSSLVFATFSALSTTFAEAIHAKIVIVDEAGTVLEPALFQVIERQVETLGMFGDPQQRPPYSLAAEDRAINADVTRSVLAAYDDAWDGNWLGVTFDTQYRCHYQIGKLCATLFYDYTIRHQSDESRDYLEDCAVFGREPCRNRRVLHLSVSPPGEINPIRDGGDNWMEVWVICECLMKIRGRLARRRERKTVLVMTPYNSQKERLERMFYSYCGWWRDMLDVRVRTVDSCQGEEEDIAIITFGWRNEEGHIGFLADAKPRLLVPMSRPRDYLILVAHEPTFRLHQQRSRGEAFWTELFDLLDDPMIVRYVDTRSSRRVEELMQDDRYCEWLSE